MDWTVLFGGEAFDVVVTMSGDATGAELVAMTDEYLSDPRWRPGSSLLLDTSLLDLATVTTADLRRAADNGRRRDEEIGSGYMVIVTGSTAGFGLARMFQAFRDSSSGPRVHVAVSVEEASRWLTAEQAKEASA